MNYCNHNCTGFSRFDCTFRTSDGYCTLSQCISYSDKTEEGQIIPDDELYNMIEEGLADG